MSESEKRLPPTEHRDLFIYGVISTAISLIPVAITWSKLSFLDKVIILGIIFGALSITIFLQIHLDLLVSREWPISIRIDFVNRVVYAETKKGVKSIRFRSISCVETNKLKCIRLWGYAFPPTAVGIFRCYGRKAKVFTDKRYSLVIESEDGEIYVYWTPKEYEYLCRS